MKKTVMLFALFVGLTASAAVHEIQLVVKTTTPAETTLKASASTCEMEGKIAYRKPGTMKIKIVTWGDECDSTAGFVMWNETQGIQYAADTRFAWEFLTRIGKTGADVEGLWISELECDSGVSAGYLYGGGMGKVKGSGQLNISGNFAGYMYAGQIVKVTKKDVKCTYCDVSGGVEVTTLDAVGWGVCGCEEPDERTVAHGTWTMKYNGSASKKYDETGDIAASYKFPKYIKL